MRMEFFTPTSMDRLDAPAIFVSSLIPIFHAANFP